MDEAVNQKWGEFSSSPSSDPNVLFHWEAVSLPLWTSSLPAAQEDQAAWMTNPNST